MKKHTPLFVTEMKLLMDAIQYQPDSLTFQNGLSNLLISISKMLSNPFPLQVSLTSSIDSKKLYSPSTIFYRIQLSIISLVHISMRKMKKKHAVRMDDPFSLFSMDEVVDR